MNCPYCNAKQLSVAVYECGTGCVGQYPERSPRCHKAEVLNLKGRITELSVERNDLREQVLSLQDLQHSIGTAIMKFVQQLTRNK